MFTLKDALSAANKLNIKFNKFTPIDLLTGINIELEHGKINKETNVTNDDLIITTKIALAHLNEFPNYYNQNYGLPMLEKYLQSKNNNRGVDRYEAKNCKKSACCFTYSGYGSRHIAGCQPESAGCNRSCRYCG